MTMSRFFNITTSDDGISTIFLYGDIGDYTEVQSGRIAQELMEAERVSRRIHIRINSNGGEVYSGIAIFNALRQSKADIRIYVDGIAASMASVIALCGNNRLVEPQKNREDMNLEDVKKRPRFKDCASDADVFRMMDQLEEEAGKVPGLTRENTDLKAKVKTYEDKAAADDIAARKQLLDAAEKDGRIDATTRPIYENLLANDRENGEKALAQLPVKRRVMEDLHLEPDGEESPWNRRMREIKDKRKK